MADVKPPDTFTCFVSLPAEIKNKIWEIAAHQRIRDTTPQAHICKVFTSEDAMIDVGRSPISAFQGAASVTQGNVYAEPFCAPSLCLDKFHEAIVPLDNGETAMMISDFKMKNKETKIALGTINVVRPKQDLFIIRFQDLGGSDYLALHRTMQVLSCIGITPENIGIEVCPLRDADMAATELNQRKVRNLIGDIVDLFANSDKPPQLWWIVSGPATMPRNLAEFQALLSGRCPAFTGQGYEYIEITAIDRWTHYQDPLLANGADGFLKLKSGLDISPRAVIPRIGFMDFSPAAIHIASADPFGGRRI